MKNFKIVDNSEFAAKKAHAKFIGHADFDRDYIVKKWNENRIDEIVDSLYDLDGDPICEDENGDLYVVSFEPLTHVPLAWCRVRIDRNE